MPRAAELLGSAEGVPRLVPYHVQLEMLAVSSLRLGAVRACFGAARWVISANVLTLFNEHETAPMRAAAPQRPCKLIDCCEAALTIQTRALSNLKGKHDDEFER